jgi:hypothetical protein
MTIANGDFYRGGLADCTDQASPPNPIIADQRGFPRPDNGEADCDIGAYEFQDTAAKN